MHQKITIVETVNSLEKNIPLLYNNKPLAVDTETTGLSPFQADLRLLQLSDDENTLVIDVQKVGVNAASQAAKPLLSEPNRVKIFHNAKFDLKFIKHHLKIDVDRVFDSYLASILCEAGVKTPRGWHKLDQVAQRYLKENISKDEQRSDWSGELSSSQITYAAKDAQILLPLRESIIERLRTLGLFRCATLEFEAIPSIVWMELCGFYLDIAQWNKVSGESLSKSDEVAQEIFAELQPFLEQASLFGNTEINLNSPDQVQNAFKAYGIPMPDSTRNNFLQPLVDEYPLVAKLLEYRKWAKRHSSFGDSWEEYINPVTGRIHADFHQIGAETGRFSCSNPNLQQIPKENFFRNCFKAEKGNTLVSGDYSQIELRILADLSKDPYALEAFEQDLDFHTAMGAKIAKIPIERVTKKERDPAKNCNFAIPYGAGASKVAATAKISQEEGQNLVDTYFDAVPNFKRWIQFQKYQVLRTRCSRTVSGRVAKYIFDDNDGGQRSQAQRNAVNMPIQGSSCDILKRALKLFYDKTRDRHNKIKLVNIVHDEINVETPKDMVEEVSADLQSCMTEAGYDFLKKVKVKVDISESTFWTKE